MLEGDGVIVRICYCVMKPSKAACFGPSSRTLVTKQDKHGTDKIASVFMQNYPASLKPF